MTALFHNIIIGPIRSRRLGLSLGVNLLPTESKICSFDCIYCECGWNDQSEAPRSFASRENVQEQLREALMRLVADSTLPDVITFAGNGEPTLHPQFEAIIDDTITLRNQLCPTAKISVLSNSTRIGDQSVRRALMRVDNNILKLDSAIETTATIMNKPLGQYSVNQVIEQMKQLDGQLIIQTMFLRGECDGQAFDNTTSEELSAWLSAVKSISPQSVMIYSLDRDTPCKTLQKVPREQLEAIAVQVEAIGIHCSVA